MRKKKLSLKVVTTFITSLILLTLSCQEVDNKHYVPVCKLGETRTCVGRTLGECEPGYRICKEVYTTGAPVSFWGECEGIVLPREEVCDYKDNDCDNRIDNGVTNRCGTCGVEPAEICDGIDNNCNGTIDEGFADIEELCDGIDQDCDGVVDEGLSKRRVCDPQDAQDTIIYNDDPNSRSTCTHGWQECREGDWTECADWRGPEPEICDGWDNDCNGFVDEIDTLRNQCGLTDTGLCDYGYEVCIGGEVACFEAIDPQNEICDALDNDCDGFVDEDLQRECENQCGRGIEICALGNWIGCTAPAATEEICDGEDNDCDGLVDEDLVCLCLAGDAQPCPNDPCGWGIMICQQDGTWGPCEGNVPQPEICNNHDDNCNDLVDEDLFLECYDGDPEEVDIGLCLAGTTTCTEGVWGPCKDQVLPADERCDGLDNDCDGVVDNIERFWEKVDMIFAIDVSGSMNMYIRALTRGIVEYVLSLQGTEHQFGIVLFGSAIHPYGTGEGYLHLQLTDINDFVAEMANVTTTGSEEPSIDVFRDISSPLNPLNISWRPDATPIVVLLGDEPPQSFRRFLPDDAGEYSDPCDLPGCHNATNPNWTDGDALESFVFALSPFMSTWDAVCYAPGQRVFNISRVLDEDLLAIDLALIFQEICIEP